MEWRALSRRFSHYVLCRRWILKLKSALLTSVAGGSGLLFTRRLASTASQINLWHLHKVIHSRPWRRPQSCSFLTDSIVSFNLSNNHIPPVALLKQAKTNHSQEDEASFVHFLTSVLQTFANKTNTDANNDHHYHHHRPHDRHHRHHCNTSHTISSFQPVGHISFCPYKQELFHPLL